MGKTKLNKMSDLQTSDETKDSIFEMFSQDEFDVAEILLDIPDLISSSNNPMSSMNNNSPKSRNFKSSSYLLQIPPSPPRLQKKSYGDLMQEYAELIVRKETFKRELEKLRSYYEQQKAFNLLLKKEEKRLLRPSSAGSTAVEVKEDHLPPKKGKKNIKIKKCLRTGECTQG